MTTKVITTASARVAGTALRGSLLAARIGGRATMVGVRAGIRRTQSFPDAPELPDGAFVDLPGRGRVFVVDSGSPRPDAPTLLLFHGLATTSYLTWFSTFDQLRQDHRIVMLDQRWHGRGIVSEAFSLDDCVDDAAAVLDHLGIDRVVAVGYSMGGALAQVFWHRHPDRTAGLVLASTAARWRASVGDALFYPALGLANDRFRDHYREQVGQVRAGLSEVPLTGAEMSVGMSAWAWSEFRATSAWAMPEVLGELGRFDARSWLADVAVPAAVVITAKDRAIPTRRQRELAAAIPGAAVHEAPGGHTSLVFDVERWRPIFLAAVEAVVSELARTRNTTEG